jgi:Putative prokaryotic signal transducing protein
MSADNARDDIVRLATAANPLQAHIWEQALKEAGIRCQVVGDFLDAGVGDIPGLSAEVWVHRDDLARAEEILRQGQEVSDAESVDESEEP